MFSFSIYLQKIREFNLPIVHSNFTTCKLGFIIGSTASTLEVQLCGAEFGMCYVLELSMVDVLEYGMNDVSAVVVSNRSGTKLIRSRRQPMVRSV